MTAPTRFITGHGWIATSVSKRRTRPLVGRTSPRIMPTVVLLPAPFGPRKLNTSRSYTRRFISATAVTGPYSFHKPSVRRISVATNNSFAASRSSPVLIDRPPTNVTKESRSEWRTSLSPL